MPEPDRGRDEVVDRRMAAVLSVAAEFRTEVALTELAALLPAHGPSDPTALAEWVRAHPQTARLEGDRVRVVGAAAASTVELDERQRRGSTYFEAAQALITGPFRALDRLVRTVCVTGSTAYQVPLEGDDLDLMIVARDGTMWLLLLLAFLTLRRQRTVALPAGARWCLNYALDDRAAREAFRRPRGFLFAREALTARPVIGAGYYGELLESAPWMREELPRLYATRAAEAPADSLPTPPTPFVFRLANALSFPLLATYLHMKGLRENARLRRAGEHRRRFATVTSWHEFSLNSARYESIEALFTQPAAARAGEAPA